MDHRGTGTDLSLTDAESNESTPVKQRSTCEENEEGLSIKLSSEDDHQSECKKTTQTVFLRNIIESKELLQFRKDNIAYFIASDENPCDKGSRVLIEANKIPDKQTVSVGNISETRRNNNKYLFGLCVQEGNPESQQIIKNNLRDTFALLR